MILRVVWLFLALLLTGGCATQSVSQRSARRFDFSKDTFHYANELLWVYFRDPSTGKMNHRRQEPVPDYTHHCFVVARSTKQFFELARFEPSQPKLDEDGYRKLVKQLMRESPRHIPADKIVFPGYADLRSFSTDYEHLLKEECGGAWQSYVQRGHWRMIMPFSNARNDREVANLRKNIDRNGMAVVHVECFPKLSINHAVVFYDYQTTRDGVDFTTYDPNSPQKPRIVHYDTTSHRFHFPETNYYGGGEVKIYEVYHRWNY